MLIYSFSELRPSDLDQIEQGRREPYAGDNRREMSANVREATDEIARQPQRRLRLPRLDLRLDLREGARSPIEKFAPLLQLRGTREGRIGAQRPKVEKAVNAALIGRFLLAMLVALTRIGATLSR